MQDLGSVYANLRINSYLRYYKTFKRDDCSPKLPGFEPVTRMKFRSKFKRKASTTRFCDTRVFSRLFSLGEYNPIGALIPQSDDFGQLFVLMNKTIERCGKRQSKSFPIHTKSPPIRRISGKLTAGPTIKSGAVLIRCSKHGPR